MRITIGEIVNVLMDYSNSIDVSITKGVPFLRARISMDNAFTIFYLYVIQTAENTYAACDSRDDHNGERFFPTGNTCSPFIIETDIIRDWFGVSSGNDISYKYDTVVKGLSFKDFITHLYSRLSYYEIIRFNPKDFDIKISEMGFSSTRIHRAIETEFKVKKCHLGTISDLVDIVVRQKERFSLGKLKENETDVIRSKLRLIGINITIDCNNCISSIKFNRRKEYVS